MDHIPVSTVSRTLLDYSGERLIVPELRGKDVVSVIHELSRALHREGRIPDLLPFYQAALNGEYLAATVTALGWALPHARVFSLNQPCFAVGRCPAPIIWAAQARHPVQLIFLFAVPETDTRGYLGILAALARLSRNLRLSERLAHARGAAEILDVLRQANVSAAAELSVASQ